MSIDLSVTLAADLDKRPIGRPNTKPVLGGQIEADRGHAPEVRWWVEEDLNLRPHAYQACALTT